MSGIVARLFGRKNDEPEQHPLVQVSYRLTAKEYGVKDSHGHILWFYAEKSEDSLKDALYTLDNAGIEGAVLMQRIVGAAREVDHVRFRP